ncbi:MAG: ABC transporter substrate-binding protein [Lachnospirales bacterium]
MKKILFLMLMLLTVSVGCSSKEVPKDNPTSAETSEEISQEDSQVISTEIVVNTVTEDREGNAIELPKEINRIISMGPSNTEVLMALGLQDKIVATDTYSEGIEGVGEIPMFSIMEPDSEQLLALEPDVIFVTGMSKASGEDPFELLKNAGITIIYIPSSNSIDAIKEDIRYMAKVTKTEDIGEEIVNNMETEINKIAEIGKTIEDKKTVYFEIAAAPSMYSFGKGVFLNEIIEIVGAENVLSDEESWISVTEEVVMTKDPDVILTSVYYLDDPVSEIKSRAGWDALSAVANNEVYQVDPNYANRPSQNVVLAMREIGQYVYPEYYGED